MKLKGFHFADVAEIREAVTDELKKVQKEEFSAAFQKMYDGANTCIYMSMKRILNETKGICLRHLPSIFTKKNQSLNFWIALCILPVGGTVPRMTRKFRLTCRDIRNFAS